MLYLEDDKKITEKEFDNMWENNSHGGGLASYKNGVFSVMKTLDKAEFHEGVFQNINIKGARHVIHFRLASVGSRTVENCHPFDINGRYQLAHNGTFHTFGVDPKHDKSDTRQVSELFSLLPYNFMKNYAIKLLVNEYIDKQKVILLGKDTYIFNEKDGTVDGGRWFSNTSFRTKYSQSSNDWKNKQPNHLYSGPTNVPFKCVACSFIADYQTFDKDLRVCDSCALFVYEYAIENEIDVNESLKIWCSYIAPEVEKYEDLYDDDAFLANGIVAYDYNKRPQYIPENEWKAFCKATEPLPSSKSKVIYLPTNTKENEDPVPFANLMQIGF